MSWGLFISASVGVWVKKALAAIGVGAITYAGWSVIKTQISSSISGALGGLAGSVYDVLALAGLVDAIGIWLGAMTAAVTLLSIDKLGLLTR